MLRFDVLELPTGVENIFEMIYSTVWQENQVCQLNTDIWSIIRLQHEKHILSHKPSTLILNDTFRGRPDI